ncbi:hypothetical protein Jiend_06020 [Micromonospora endophytica]|nr:hypothetical protein Jiend_06020 [Micromonospora endophytica]
MHLERVGEEVPGQPRVHDQALTGGGDVPLELVDVAVDRLVQLGVQVELKSGHLPLLGHLPVEIADTDPA